MVHASDCCFFWYGYKFKMSLCGIVILIIPYLQMIMVRMCLYFYTSSVLHIIFADICDSGIAVVVVVVNLV